MRNIFRNLIVLIVAFTAGVYVNAQIVDPIRWETSVEMDSETDGALVFKVSIDKGWHLYALQLPEGGPMPTAVTLTKTNGIVPGALTPSREPLSKFDTQFDMDLAWWDADVEFRLPFTVDNPDGYEISGTVSYQGCNDQSCLAPAKEAFDFVDGVPVATGLVDFEADAPGAEPAGLLDDLAAKWWQPVAMPQSAPVGESSWWYIFLWGFIGGLLALLTPCVWPMIPLTVSFFLKKNGSKAKSIRDATIYGASIVVIYLVLGLAITMAFGASKLNDLATNAVFNIAFFLLLVVFAVSFFGAFDIKLPSRWSNSMDGRAERTTGLISIFFMAFTLALVSFSCTGPIIGTLLVEAASMGDITGPAIGMGAFALALALPFTLFAIFPSWLKEMPRSGGWLNSVKVILGFLELALSLKFLSVADLSYGWGILDREVFLSLWIVIFILLGVYLLGKIRFSHDSPTDHVSIPRFFMALVSLGFAVYLIPGLWGAPLKATSAFVPPLYTQDFNLYSTGEYYEVDDYDEGMRLAVEMGRPVLVDFSGHGCVNCRKMEGAVFDTPGVRQMLHDRFILVKLMVDDKRQLEHPFTVSENGRTIDITTIGEKWSYLQRHKFGTNTQPYYVILNQEGLPMNSAAGYDENSVKFMEWLGSGIARYNESN